jgi:hypothetical protein
MKKENTAHINDKLKTYLVGSMEVTGAKDCGRGWRDYIQPKLEARGIYVFNPSFEEELKVGMRAEEFHEKLRGLKASGHWDLYVSEMDKIWKGVSYISEKGNLMHIMGDKDYVMASHFITAHITAGDKPFGTAGEMYQAWLFNTPIYLVTDVPKTELNGSCIYFVLSSGGEVFKHWSQFLEHIDKKYKLKEDTKYYEQKKEVPKVEEEKPKDDTKT